MCEKSGKLEMTGEIYVVSFIHFIDESYKILDEKSLLQCTGYLMFHVSRYGFEVFREITPCNDQFQRVVHFFCSGYRKFVKPPSYGGHHDVLRDLKGVETRTNAKRRQFKMCILLTLSFNIYFE